MSKLKKLYVSDIDTLVTQWHPTKNHDLKPENFTSSSGEKVWWKCPKGDDHEWKAALNTRRRGSGCPFCSGRKATRLNNFLVLFPEISTEWHPTKNYDLKPEDFKSGSNKKVWWKCPKGDDHEWEASTYTRSRGTGCPKCARLARRKTNPAG